MSCVEIPEIRLGPGSRNCLQLLLSAYKRSANEILTWPDLRSTDMHFRRGGATSQAWIVSTPRFRVPFRANRGSELLNAQSLAEQSPRHTLGLERFPAQPVGPRGE